MPDFRFERRLEARVGGPVAGVDEAGRGPLAGPVVAAALIFTAKRLPRALTRELDDSKTVPPARREALYAILGDVAVFAVGVASVAEIEEINILWASMLAMQRAVSGLAVTPAGALVDGNRAPDLACLAEPVVDGDARCFSVAAASIVAKVTRDRMMAELADLHPGYGWERNAGYGTPEHHAALARLGVAPPHRRTFAPIRNLLNP